MTPGDRVVVTMPRSPSREGEYVEDRGTRCRVLLDGEHVTRIVLRERVKASVPRITRIQSFVGPVSFVRDGFAEGPMNRVRDEAVDIPLRAVPKPPKPLRDAAYMAFVRAHGCCVESDGATKTPCCGSVVAHHHGPRGMGEKTDDYRCVSLCDGHHREFHQHGTVGEWTRTRLDAFFGRMMVCLLTERFLREHGEGFADALINHMKESQT